MTNPTVLGTNTAIVTSSALPVTPSPSNPALVIYFNDLKSSDWDTPNLTSLDPWVLCILRKLFTFNTTAINENHDLIVLGKFFGISSRNQLSNRITENYSITAFGGVIDTGVDPDTMT